MRRAYGLSDLGRRRDTNEDFFLIDEEVGLFIVADGMGGYAAGEVASREAARSIFDMVSVERKLIGHVSSTPDDHRAVEALRRLLESAVQSATYMVFGMAEQNPDQQGMGTTASTLLVSGSRAFVAHVGDSRIYLFRGDIARQITEDHTLINWQLREGIITKEEASIMPHKNVITRAVGNKEYVEVDTSIHVLETSDEFLLCSDGLHNYFTDDEISELMKMEKQQAAKKLIEGANDRGGKDNITAVIVGAEEAVF